MTPNFRLILLLISCCFALSACGLKGDLYLPDDSPEDGSDLSPDQSQTK